MQKFCTLKIQYFCYFFNKNFYICKILGFSGRRIIQEKVFSKPLLLAEIYEFPIFHICLLVCIFVYACEVTNKLICIMYMLMCMYVKVLPACLWVCGCLWTDPAFVGKCLPVKVKMLNFVCILSTPMWFLNFLTPFFSFLVPLSLISHSTIVFHWSN